MSKRIPLILLGLLVVAILLCWGYVWTTLNFSYSDGEHAGFLQKFSRQGWICKTWEGEILLSSMPGAIPERFPFTVRDPVIAKQMAAAMGKHVVLSYEQHKGIPTQCFGETEYYVSQVQVTP
jgi:hypothetical protein